MTTDAESGIFSHSKGIMLRSLFFSLSLDLISLILSADLIRHGLSPFLIQYPNQTPISYPDLITQSPTCRYHDFIAQSPTCSYRVFIAQPLTCDYHMLSMLVGIFIASS